jgi:hypothetical protein
MLEFSDVTAARPCVYCYLDRYYIGCLTEYDGRWRICIENRDQGEARTRDEAEEVVRMWVQFRCNTVPGAANPSPSRSADSEET